MIVTTEPPPNPRPLHHPPRGLCRYFLRWCCIKILRQNRFFFIFIFIIGAPWCSFLRCESARLSGGWGGSNARADTPKMRGWLVPVGLGNHVGVSEAKEGSAFQEMPGQGPHSDRRYIGSVYLSITGNSRPGRRCFFFLFFGCSDWS